MFFNRFMYDVLYVTCIHVRVTNPFPAASDSFLLWLFSTTVELEKSCRLESRKIEKKAFRMKE